MVNSTPNLTTIPLALQLEFASIPTSHPRSTHRSTTTSTSTTPTPQATSQFTSTSLSVSALSPPSSNGTDISTVISSSSSFVSTSATSALNSSSVITATASTMLSPMLSSPTFTHTSTSTPAPSQMHDFQVKVPIIVVVCIATPFILTLAVFFVIWRSRRRQPVQTKKAQSTFLLIDAPQIGPTTGEAPNEQLSSSSHNVNRPFPMQLEKRQRIARDRFNSRTRGVNSPIGSLRRVTEQLSRRGSRTVPPERSAEMKQQMTVLHNQVQQLSDQLEHVQRRLEHADGIQSLSDHGEPPAYV